MSLEIHEQQDGMAPEGEVQQFFSQPACQAFDASRRIA